jgi:hypothetical protein
VCVVESGIWNLESGIWCSSVLCVSVWYERCDMPGRYWRICISREAAENVLLLTLCSFALWLFGFLACGSNS